MLPKSEMFRALALLSETLAARGRTADIVILGGASLAMRELTTRATADVDVLGLRSADGTVESAFPFPTWLREAADDVATALGLPRMWLDDRVGSDFSNAAPAGFEGRLTAVPMGALCLWHLDPNDILSIKIVASAERWGEPNNKHWDDVVRLGVDFAAIDRARAFAADVWAPSSAAWSALDEIESRVHDE